MNNSFILALSILVGSIIGGGVFGIPFVMAKSGLVPTIFYFLIVGGAVMLLHLLFGEVCLRTKQKARLVGYTKKYLGTKVSWLAVFSTFFGIVGALLAYTIIGGKFLFLLFGSVVPISEASFAVLFWLVLSLFIARGIQVIAKAELVMNIALFGVVGVIFFFGAPHINLSRFVLFDDANLFVPYGVILFALAGWGAVAEIVDFFKNTKEKGSLRPLIIWAWVITVVFSFAFGIFVVGISGSATTQDALLGLEPFLGSTIVLLGALFGLLAIAASFLVSGNYLKNSLRYDFNFPYVFAVGAATLTPLLLFLVGFREFIVVLGIVGALTGVIEGLLILFLYKKAKVAGQRVPEYSVHVPKFLLYGVGIVLVVGVAAQLYFQYAR